MKNWISLTGLPAVAAFLVCLPVLGHAEVQLSEALANQMYCSVGSLLEGDVGLLLGLMLVFMGIWALVQGGKIVAVLPIIIVGSLVTALPSLIAATFSGLGNLLVQTGISSGTFTPPTCNGDSGPITEDQIKALQDMQDNTRYVDTGVYGPTRPPQEVAPNSSGSPDDRDQ